MNNFQSVYLLLFPWSLGILARPQIISSFPVSPVEGGTNIAELSYREKLLLLQKHFQTFQKLNNLTPGDIATKPEKHQLGQERQFPTVQTHSRIHHPEILLNQLSSGQKNKFLNQFESLSQEQQIFAYNKFLSSPQEIQEFAINQFLSLDCHTLARAIQDEIGREGEIL